MAPHQHPNPMHRAVYNSFQQPLRCDVCDHLHDPDYPCFKAMPWWWQIWTGEKFCLCGFEDED
jgi:hypothetical protein